MPEQTQRHRDENRVQDIRTSEINLLRKIQIENETDLISLTNKSSTFYQEISTILVHD